MHPRFILDRYQIFPKKSLGQNFIVEEATVRRIIDAADLDGTDIVLEIGPGLGALTGLMALQVDQVIAVELDDRLIPILENVLSEYPNVQLVHGDILTLNIGSFCGGRFKVVANLPYYITGAVLRYLLEQKNPVDRPVLMVLTVQQEVADKIVAVPGQMSLLAVSVQLYGTVRQVMRIKAGAFYPRPDVDSAVIRIDVHPEPVIPVEDEPHFFRVVKAGFGQKRKQLRNSLRGGLSLTVDEVDAALSRAGIDPMRRAETLSIQEWVGLAVAIARLV